ncbi:MAG: DUF364 domain-containing protein [Pseudomonadota bacterium]
MLDDLAALALDSHLARERVTAVHRPAIDNVSTNMEHAFAGVQLGHRTTGLAYARLPHPDSTPVAANVAVAEGQPAGQVIESLVTVGGAIAPASMATLNAVLLARNAASLDRATALVDTVVPFAAAETVGMVGYFAPLVPILLAAGHTLAVLELDASTWQAGPRLNVGNDPTVLAHCATVLCTATVLLNGSFDAVRAAAANCSRFVMVGPTTPLAPAVLGAHGVTHMAGRVVADDAAFWSACRASDDWTPSTRKFVLETKNA